MMMENPGPNPLLDGRSGGFGSGGGGGYNYRGGTGGGFEDDPLSSPVTVMRVPTSDPFGQPPTAAAAPKLVDRPAVTGIFGL